MSRAIAEMMPAVTLPPSPNGLPIVRTQSPTRVLLESPQVAAGSGAFGSTLRSAISVTASRPTTCACSEVPSDSVTVICCAFAMTWWFVTIRPDGSMTNPEPSEATRGPGAPGLPLSPKNSRNTSSSVLPAELCGVSGAAGPGGGAAWVETLTTTLSSRPASWANISANGVSGGCGRLGAAAVSGGGCRPAAGGASCAGGGFAAGGASEGWLQPGTPSSAQKASAAPTTLPRRPLAFTENLPAARVPQHSRPNGFQTGHRTDTGGATRRGRIERWPFRHGRYEMTPRM